MRDSDEHQLRGELPSGTVTFLFTDVEGSTRLMELDRDLLQTAMLRHHTLLSAAISRHRGYVFETVGDAFYVSFEHASDAIDAAVAAQIALMAEPWDPRAPIKARMSVHSGEVERRGSKYFGAPLFRAARLLSTAHGGQIVVSSVTAQLVHDVDQVFQLDDLGEHRLRDLTRPERIWQVSHPDLPQRFPPLRSLSTQANNLPGQLTTFVGRERELLETRKLLGTTRLLTLLGTGGAGKTRLATQIGADALHDYDDGVWFVDLAPVANPDQVFQVVASAIGVTPRANQTPRAAVIANLEGKRALLILDNCEHLIAACADAADVLLRACPRLQVLATSREVLSVPGEVSWRVPSLSLPPNTGIQTAEQVTQFEAVRLFVDRAMLASPRFTVTNANAPAVAQICWRLDGIPLAIELAASRIRTLSAEQIAVRLDDCFRVLTGGSRTLLPRQQTLRALIDWSYDLLSGPERFVLRRLSCFSGTFELAAAEAVCSDQSVGEMEVLDLLSQLVDKSLVYADEQGEAIRYRLLESMRQYSREKLTGSGDRADATTSHAAYYVRLCEDAEPHLTSRDRATWLKRLEPELDNIRAILTRCQELPDQSPDGAVQVESGLRIIGALGWYWIFRGAPTEGLFWFNHLLNHPRPRPTAVLGKALMAAGLLAGIYGDSPEAQARFGEAAHVCELAEDKLGQARALVLLSAFDSEATILGENTVDLDAAISVMKKFGDRHGLALSLRLAGVIAFQSGNRAVARDRQEAALALFRELGDQWFAAQALNSLGDSARIDRDDARATAAYEEALGLCRTNGLGGLIPSLLHNLGHLSRRAGDGPVALQHFREGLTSFRAQADSRGVAECLGGLAMAYAVIDRMELSATLFGAAEALLLASGAKMWPQNHAEFDECRRDVRSRLGESRFDAQESIGNSMPLDEAVQLALGT